MQLLEDELSHATFNPWLPQPGNGANSLVGPSSHSQTGGLVQTFYPMEQGDEILTASILLAAESEKYARESPWLEGVRSRSRARKQAMYVARLMEKWLRDESGYDEQTWPAIKAALEEERERRSARPLFPD